MFVAWLLGLLGAVQGECIPIPIMGAYFQIWFKGISKDA